MDVPTGLPDGAEASVGDRLRAWVGSHRWWTVIAVVLTIVAVDAALLPIPTLRSYRSGRPSVTAFQRMYLEAGNANRKKRTIRKTWVPFRSIAPSLVRAVLVSEDASFWNHNGFDWYEVQQTIEKSLSRGSVGRGASTITQQLMKNLFLSPSRDPLRKWHEVVLTVVAEWSLPKSRILELYLNEIEWGEGVYGIGAAANHYFGKSASDLTPWESALLAAVIPNPKLYDVRAPGPMVLRRAQRIRRLMNIPDPADVASSLAGESAVDTTTMMVDSAEGRSATPIDSMATDSTQRLYDDDVPGH